MFRGSVSRLGCKLLGLAICLPLAAQERNTDYQYCADANLPAEGIAACTRIIDDRTEGRQNRAGAYSNRGLWYAKTGDFEHAISDYGEAIALNPDYAEAYLSRGNAYMQKKDLTTAIADYTEAINRSPKVARAYNNRGLALLDQREYESAIADFSEAVRLDPNYGAAYNNRGLAEITRGEVDRAVADFNVALWLDPDDAQALNNRGLAQFTKGEIEHAIADYTDAIRLNAIYSAAYSNRGNAYQAKGNIDDAIADFNEAIRLSPTHVEPYNSRGFARFCRGQFGEAAVDFSRSIELKPDAFPAILRFLALSRLGQAAEGDVIADAARLRSGAWPSAIIQLLAGEGTPEATREAAHRTEEACQAQFYIAEWQLLRKDSDGAAKSLRGALDTCPRTSVEHRCAAAELSRLDASP
jgi:tetratricopeptide (TPR) repeat protein